MPHLVARAARALALAALVVAPALAHAQGATARRTSGSPSDARALAGYRLTMPEMRQYLGTMRELAVVIKADRKLGKRFTSKMDDSIEQIAERLGATPEFRPAFAKTGMTPRRFALAQYTYVGTAMAVGIPNPQSTPEQLVRQMGIDVANVAFIRTHGAEIEAQFRKLQAEFEPADDEESEDEGEDPAR